MDNTISTCLFCDKVFNGFEKLVAHTAVHTRERNYFCNVDGCNTTWPNPSAVYHHKRRVHRNDKFKCSACNRVFNAYDTFRKHRRDFHDGQSQMVNGRHTITAEVIHGEDESSKKRKNKFTCTTCGKSFSELRHLKMHMNLHTGERPYACQQCSAIYFHRNSLYQHRRSKHAVPKIRIKIVKGKEDGKIVNAFVAKEEKIIPDMVPEEVNNTVQKPLTNQKNSCHLKTRKE